MTSAPPTSAQVVSPFPAPPAYARNYTTEDVAAGRAPPPPPVFSDFMAFGEEYHLDEEIIRPLHLTGIRQLYTNKNDWKNEMKKLNRSAVAAFLDLIQLLIRCPDHPDRVEKLNDIHDIFINMHHLINEFRPIQARDTLKLMQDKQLKELDDTLRDYREFISEAKAVLKKVLENQNRELLPVPPRRPDLEDDDLEEIGMEEEKEEPCPSPSPSSSALRRSLVERRRAEAELLMAELGGGEEMEVEEGR